MFERGISDDDVRHALANGETIEDYPDDTPFPSRLVLVWRGPRPLHVVVATDPQAGEDIVVSVYEPSLDQWGPGFRKRRRR
jgi:hypothetical protein